MKKKQIEQGDLVKDLITGFVGIVVARTEWINGCIRWTVQPRKLTKEGGQRATDCFDDEQLAVVRKNVVTSYARSARTAGRTSRARKPPGGPRPSPSRPSGPKR